MEEKLKDIEDTLKRLHKIQASHLEEFRKKDLPDLDKQSAERSLEVDKLMKSVNDVVTLIKNTDNATSESMVLFLNKRISTLLEQNNELEIKVKDFKNNLKNGMKKISTGKKVIGSYRSSAVVANDPKVLSISN